MTTKIVAGVIKQGDEPLIGRWVGTNIRENPKVHRQLEQFFQKHGVESVVVTDGNVGSPHEEGEDFPIGEDGPFGPRKGPNTEDFDETIP